MKKALVFIFLLAFFFHVHTSFAQENVSTDAATLSPTPTPEYQLPYPGLLPDSPLYFLKTFRDRIIDFLVANPLKKAELDLLQADKRLAAGIALVGKGKDALAESTISKGENYFADAIAKANEAKSQGMDVNDIMHRLSMAAKKHQEVLRTLEEKASKDVKVRLHVLLVRMEEFEKQVNKLNSK